MIEPDMKVKSIYFDCPSCGYRFGPMTKDNAEGYVGCPQEEGKYERNKFGKQEFVPHRYTLSQMAELSENIKLASMW